MAKLSPAREGVELLPNLELFSRGKVRDIYVLRSGNFLSVTTDGISVFDFVLNTLISQKGMVLNAMNHFWDSYLKNFGIKTHLVAAGSAIDKYLPAKLKNNINLQSRAVVIRKLEIVPIEFIARAVLTGSAIREYEEKSQICGHKLLPGLEDGDALPCILDTPTTKAREGHDENLPAEEVRKKYPEQTYLLLKIFQIASNYAEKNGIKIADTKLEFGINGTVGDEILTPDSSRFYELKIWQDGRKVVDGRKAPPPYDKQLVRNWASANGVNKLDPKNQKDVDRVHSLAVPGELIKETTKVYRYIFWRLTGFTIESYLRREMGVNIFQKLKN